MEEKKYLKWYNKIGYGSGDIAGNVVYAFLTSFMMVLSLIHIQMCIRDRIMGIDRILDMTRTAVNITGDAVCTTIVAHQNKALDKKVFYETE